MRIVRRYANDHRLFEVVLEGSAIRRRVGLLEAWSEATLHVEQHRSATAARAAYEKMCKVYVDRAIPLVGETIDETFAAVAPTLPLHYATNAALEAECLASPDAPEAWSVYADWLMAEGDPRGQLAALHLAGNTAAATDYLATHGALLGDVADAVTPTWRHGFVTGARIEMVERREGNSIELVDATAGFLALPIARFVRALRFGLAERNAGENDWGPTLAAVIASPVAGAITELRFDDYTSDDNEISWTPFGDLSAIGSLPALEVLAIRSGEGGVLGALDLPRLRTYVRISGGLAPSELADLARSKLPRLEHLELWLGTPNYGGDATLEDLAPILDGAVAPALRHLGLPNTMLTNDLVAALAGSAILPRLRSLDLSRGTMMGRGAAALIEHAGAFRHLAAIDLDDNHLMPSEVARIQAELPQVSSTSQRDEDREGPEDDEETRFVALGE